MTAQRMPWLRLLAVAAISSLVGVVLSRWEWLLSVGGFDVSVERSAAITFEYWLGIPIAAFLGYVFSKGAEPIMAGLFLMWGATAINHIAYIARNGAPNLWPIELAFLGAFTVPYIVAALGGAYLSRRILGKHDAI